MKELVVMQCERLVLLGLLLDSTFYTISTLVVLPQQLAAEGSPVSPLL